MTPYARSTRYSMRHALRLWAWGICTEFEICRTWRTRNRRNGR